MGWLWWAILCSVGQTAASEVVQDTVPKHLAVGVGDYYLFERTLTVRVVNEPATLKVYLPTPLATSRQHVVAERWLGPERKVRTLQDPKTGNRLTVLIEEVKPGSEKKWVQQFLLRLHPLTLQTTPAQQIGLANPESIPMPGQVDWAHWLRLDDLTGGNRTDLATAAEQLLVPDSGSLPGGPLESFGKARRLFEGVMVRLRYELRYDLKGAAKAYDEKVGECCDYAALFVAWCRMQGIPARSVNGYRYRGRWQLHGWAEFYIAGLGWIPCDPTECDTSGRPLNECFASLDQEYLSLSYDLNLQFEHYHGPPIRILQSYVYEYQGPETPQLQWDVNGKAIGPTIPSEMVRLFPQLTLPTP